MTKTSAVIEDASIHKIFDLIIRKLQEHSISVLKLREHLRKIQLQWMEAEPGGINWFRFSKIMELLITSKGII